MEALRLGLQAQNVASNAGLTASHMTTVANAAQQVGSNLAQLNPLHLWKDRGSTTETQAEHKDTLAIPPPSDQVALYIFRLCVHSGTDIPREKTKVSITIGESTAGEKKMESPLAPETSHPVWEFVTEQPIEVDFKAPNVEIQVLGAGVLGSRFLGATSLALPVGPTDGIKRQELRLQHVPAPFPGLEPPKSKLLVVWQVCSSAINQPDLIRIAEMDSQAVEKNKHTVDIKVMFLHLWTAKKAQDVDVTLQVLRGTSRSSETALPHKRTSPKIRLKPSLFEEDYPNVVSFEESHVARTWGGRLH